MIYQGYDYKISIEITCGECNSSRGWVGAGPKFWAKVRRFEDLATAMDKLKCQCGGKASKLVFDRRLRVPPGPGAAEKKRWEENWVLAEMKQVAE